MTRAPIRIVPQEEIAGGLKEPPAFRLADARSVFADRAARFETLAASAVTAGKGEPAYLRLMGKLAEAQQKVINNHIVKDEFDALNLERCRTHGLPPLGIDGALDAVWRTALHEIVAAIQPIASTPVQQVISVIRGMDTEALDNQASRLLALDFPAVDAAIAPFIGAALQVHWVKRANVLGEGVFRKLDVPTVCPVCGSPPVACVQRIGVPVPGTRYLHCVLCSTEWHMGRGYCSQCEAYEKLAYYHIDNESDAVRGEACDECKGYVKSLNQEKDSQVDPVADDLATLSLDVLLDEAGYERASPNYFFVPGQG